MANIFTGLQLISKTVIAIVIINLEIKLYTGNILGYSILAILTNNNGITLANLIVESIFIKYGVILSRRHRNEARKWYRTGQLLTNLVIN